MGCAQHINRPKLEFSANCLRKRYGDVISNALPLGHQYLQNCNASGAVKSAGQVPPQHAANELAAAAACSISVITSALTTASFTPAAPADASTAPCAFSKSMSHPLQITYSAVMPAASANSSRSTANTRAARVSVFGSDG